MINTIKLLIFYIITNKFYFINKIIVNVTESRLSTLLSFKYIPSYLILKQSYEAEILIDPTSAVIIFTYNMWSRWWIS